MTDRSGSEHSRITVASGGSGVSTLKEAKRTLLYYEKPWLKEVDEAIARGMRNLEEKIQEERREEEARTAADKAEISSIAKTWFPDVVEDRILSRRQEVTLRFDPPDWTTKSEHPDNPFWKYDPNVVLSVLEDLYEDYLGGGTCVREVNSSCVTSAITLSIGYIILRLDLSPIFDMDK